MLDTKAMIFIYIHVIYICNIYYAKYVILALLKIGDNNNQLEIPLKPKLSLF